MGTAPYQEFEFLTGTTTLSAFDVVSTTFGISSQGIQFTWSIQDTNGNNLLQHFPGVSFAAPTDGTLVATVCGTTGSSPLDIVTLGLADTMEFFVGTIANPLELDFYSVAGRWTVTYHFTGGGFTTSKIGPIGTTGLGSPLSTTSVALTLLGNVNVSHITFTTSNIGGRIVIDDFKAAVSCFCAGTRIATPDGPRAVEDLEPGDRLLRADGRETTVKWLGEQPVDVRLGHPAKINPICITAGALGENLPANDLYLSADHAIAIDGCLINAGALVNGQSIYQVAEMPLNGFTYFHIETDAHELILAEGVAAESFIDYAGTDNFANGEDRGGQVIVEMDLPRISASRLLPRAIRARLAARIGMVEAA
ncbi:MAG: Hint domain-containing protein [Rhodobacter sp.]|nr:Hint domain-containing protein [Rhodobacter sp.]